MNETKVKKIVSKYLKVSMHDIGDNTKLDSSVIKGSIMLYRMYSDLQRNGFNLIPGASPSNFKELLTGLSPEIKSLRQSKKAMNDEATINSGVGIDIQQVNELPLVTSDLDAFYTNNFTEKEIAHALKKRNPRESFAGIFALKEAILKTSYRSNDHNLRSIEIEYNGNIPAFNNYQVSISHSGVMAVAVAIENSKIINLNQEGSPSPVVIYKSNKNNSQLQKYSIIVYFIFVLLAVVFILLNN